MKKWISVLTVVSLFVGGAEVQARRTSAYGSGFYVGAAGGYATSSGSLTRNVKIGANSTQKSSMDMSAKGAVGSLFVGYDHIFRNALLAGLELDATLNGMKGQVEPELLLSPNKEKTILEAKDSYGLSLRLGALLQETFLVYGKLGIVTTKFNLKNQMVGFADKATSKRLTGFAFGAGFQVPLTDRFHLGGEYVHTRYGNINIEQTVTGVAKNEISIKPSTNTFLARLIFKI